MSIWDWSELFRETELSRHEVKHERSISWHFSCIRKCLIVTLYPKLYSYWQARSVSDYVEAFTEQCTSLSPTVFHLVRKTWNKKHYSFVVVWRMHRLHQDRCTYKEFKRLRRENEQHIQEPISPRDSNQNKCSVSIQIDLADISYITTMRLDDFLILFSKS